MIFESEVIMEKQISNSIYGYRNKALEKMRVIASLHKGTIPYTLMANGKYDNRDYHDNLVEEIGINWWTNGFFGGILWQLYHETKDPLLAGYAMEIEKKLDDCFEIFSGLHHDVGFMWLLTAVASYHETGNMQSKKRALHAATILAGRFNVCGKFIRAWNQPNEESKGMAIIDSMMNISILFWAATETKDPRFSHIARQHADTILTHFVREDGSCKHIVEFDPETGAVRKTHAGQGISSESSWTRGQAWALYGFVNAYKNTLDQKYLDVAIKNTKYFIEGTRRYDNHVPIDFLQPLEDIREDNSAAMIAISGILELAEVLGEKNGEEYRAFAEKLFLRICEEQIDFSFQSEAMVMDCSVAFHYGTESSLIYADYYFLEALLKFTKQDLKIWNNFEKE